MASAGLGELEMRLWRGAKVGSAKGRASVARLPWICITGSLVTSAQELCPSTLPSTPFLRGGVCGSLLGSHRPHGAVCVTVSFFPTGL